MIYQQQPLSTRSRSVSAHTPKRPVRVMLNSGVEQGSAIKKSEEQWLKREEQYQQTIFAKDQEIAMMKQHIQQLEKNMRQYEQNALHKQIQGLTDQIGLLLDSYNQRVQEIEELKKSKGQTHSELERQVLQLLRENTNLINSLNNSQCDMKRLSISKIVPNNDQLWKTKFIRLNKEFHVLQEKLVMALAELDNYRQGSRSGSIESIEAMLRY